MLAVVFLVRNCEVELLAVARACEQPVNRNHFGTKFLGRRGHDTSRKVIIFVERLRDGDNVESALCIIELAFPNDFRKMT